MEIILQNLTPMFSGLLTLIVSIIGKKVTDFLAEQKREQEIRAAKDIALNEGMVGLLRFRLRHVYQKAKHNGYITTDEMEVFEGLFHPYKALGGNGIIDTYHQQLLNMPNEPIEKDVEQ